MAAHWPEPPGGWRDDDAWIVTPVLADGPAEGASVKSEPPASTPPPSVPPPPVPPLSTPAPGISGSAGAPPDGPGHTTNPQWPHAEPLRPSGRPKHLALILSIVAGIVMIGIIGAATTAAIITAKAYRHSKEQQTVGMDTPVRDGEFQFTVNGMRCGIQEIGTPDDYQQPTGQFCVVTLSVMNVGKNPAVFADAIQKAHGTGGVSFISDSEAGLYANQDPNVFLNDINPGNKVQILVVYDIPPTSRIQDLEVHENPSTKGAIIKISS
jgi:hypothetical protein